MVTLQASRSRARRPGPGSLPSGLRPVLVLLASAFLALTVLSSLSSALDGWA